jgi:LysM repeat protein
LFERRRERGSIVGIAQDVAPRVVFLEDENVRFGLVKKAVFRLGMVVMAGTILGCNDDVTSQDGRDLDKPLMKRAAERVKEGDIDAAIRLYVRAVEEDPATARGHLDVALLLDDYKQDYVGAIFHYRRYLELRQETEKRGMIKERIRRAEHLFAASIVAPSQQNDDQADLAQENTSLKSNIRTLTRKLASVQSELDALRKADGLGLSELSTSGGSAVVGSRPETYTVKPGDNLTRIAEKIYGDPKRWPDIHKANSKLLGRSAKVQVGQVLKLP